MISRLSPVVYLAAVFLVVLIQLPEYGAFRPISSASRLRLQARTISLPFTSAYRISSCTALGLSMVSDEKDQMTEQERKDLWKKISQLERDAITKLSGKSGSSTTEQQAAYKLLAESVELKQSDPFMRLCSQLTEAQSRNDVSEVEKLLKKMNEVQLPPHIVALAESEAAAIAAGSSSSTSSAGVSNSMVPSSGSGMVGFGEEDVDPGSTFSDTVTEKIRVKVNAFFDESKSEPENGKFMFWYKVVIYNEGPEAVQIVARMWEIEKCKGEKEVVRGSGVMSTQPIIPPGDCFTYQSVCPLKVFPPKGKRVLGELLTLHMTHRLLMFSCFPICFMLIMLM